MNGNTNTAMPRVALAPAVTVARLIRGGWPLAGGHGPVDRERALADIARFIDAGMDTVDGADSCTGVEELCGEFNARRRADQPGPALSKPARLPRRRPE